MNNTKILVLGASGMLGSVVTNYLRQNHEVLSYDSNGFNILKQPISDLKSVLSMVSTVVNCAGIIKPRISSHTPEEVLKVNSLFPMQLEHYITNDSYGEDEDDWDDHPNIIHISSDCVFSGKNGPYSEHSTPDATDLYGISKALGEATLGNGGSITLRTSIIGEEINNKYSLLEWAKSQAGNVVSGYIDHLWSGVTTLELAKFIEFVIDNNYDDYGGVIHVAGNTITKYELLRTINKIYNLNLDIKMVESGDPINRSLLKSECNWTEEFTIKPIADQLYELREFCNES